MAVAPLFVASIAELKRKLRLSGSVQQDALAVLDGAVEEVRVGFYDETAGIGASAVTEILAISYVQNGTSADQLRRIRANNLEVSWVRLLLLRRLPTIFMDASGVAQEDWNDVPVVRSGPSDREREIKRLESEITEGLAALGAGGPDELGLIDAFAFEPEEAPPKPGASIAPLVVK